jgi:glycerophosphoryl diester phosphodiesterase
MSGVSGYQLRRVGHKGADLIAPGNTLASFDAALAIGVDMIEFDVLPDNPGSQRLVLAHDYEDAVGAPTLEEGLEHLTAAPFDGIEFDLDMKLPGYELQVVEAIRAHDVVDRALVSSQYRSSLAAIRAAEPRLRLGWSVPKVNRDPFRSPFLTVPALAVMHGMRAILPNQAARAIRARECDALMVHWRLVTARLVRAIRAAGGEMYVWTVDELDRLRQLEALGVTGVITNDPRLFAALS